MPRSLQDIYNDTHADSAAQPGIGPASSGASGGGRSLQDIYDSTHGGGQASSAAGAQPQGSLLDQWRNFDSPQGRASFAGAIGSRLSPLGEALDYQLRGSLHAATGEADPNKQMKALRTKLGDEDAYEQAPWPERGLYDFGLQVDMDPLMYETAGFGLIPKAIRGAAKTLGPMQRAAAAASPQFVRTIGKDVGDIGQAVRHGFTRLLAPGGKDAGELENQRGRGARDILLGASGKHALNEQEMSRAFTARFETTIKGLAPEEETRVYQTLNGERGAQGLNPKEQAAFDGLRKIADEAAYSEANPQLRYLISLRHGGLRDKPAAPNLFRYQKTGGEPDVSPRGGTFFSRTDQSHLYDRTKNAGISDTGGVHRVEASYAGKKPYDIAAKDFSFELSPTFLGETVGKEPRLRDISEFPSLDAYEEYANRLDLQAERGPRIRGQGRPNFVKKLYEHLTPLGQKKTLAQFEGKARDQVINARRYLRAFGVPEADAEATIQHALSASKTGDPKHFASVIMDRMAAQKARSMGYDAIRSAEDVFALDPSVIGKARKTFYAKPPELEPIDPALAPVDQHLTAEDKRMRGMGSPRLSQALYPLGRKVKKPQPLPVEPGKPASPEDELNAFLDEHAPPPGKTTTFDQSATGSLTKALRAVTTSNPRGGRLWRNVQRAKIEPMEVSPDIKEFVGPGGRRDAYRWRYLPGYNQLAGTPKQEAFEFNPLNWENPNLKERDDFKVDPAQHEQQREAFRRMLANTARESSTASLRRELPQRGLPITPNVEAALQRHVHAKGNERSGIEKGVDAYKGVLRYGRAAQVGITPFHAANIAGLQLAHAPSTIPEAVGTTIRALLPGANRHEIFRKGREMGALGPSQERIPPFASVALPVRLGIGAAGGAYTGYESDKDGTPEERWQRAGLGALAGAAAGAGVRRWSRAMTHVVFTYDDAAKQALGMHYVKRHGMTAPYQAGRQAAEDLIDYGNPSELGNGLSWVSKFPTYRSQLPFSVARGIARHPARFAAVNRAGAGIPAGGEAQTPAGPVKSYSSISDVGRMASDMKGYARSTLADPIKIVLSLAEKFSLIPKQQWGYYWTYKLDPTSKEVLINAAAAGVPEARSILDQTGVGMFRHNPTSSTLPLPIREGLFDVTGLSVGR